MTTHHVETDRDAYDIVVLRTRPISVAEAKPHRAQISARIMHDVVKLRASNNFRVRRMPVELPLIAGWDMLETLPIPVCRRATCHAYPWPHVSALSSRCRRGSWR